MKKWLVLVLCLLLTVPATADMAAQSYDVEGLEKYVSFAMDDASGEWTVNDPLFDATIDMIAAGEMKASMAKGFIVYQLRLSGNEQTGTLRPEMEINFFANKPIGTKAVSVLANGVRYDMQAAAQVSGMGGAAMEKIVLPMWDLDMIRAIAGAETVEILLHGESGVYETVISAENDGSRKAQTEANSLRCTSLIAEMENMHMDSYGLWDLSLAEWEKALGFTPVCNVSDNSAMNMIAFGERGDNVQALQEMLASAGFYAGSAENEYAEKTAAAVRRAQSFYGLLVTGSADQALIDCLQGNASVAAEEAAAQEIAMDKLGEIEIGFGRFYQARKVAPSAGDLASGLSCTDSGNVFVVCEGAIFNGSAEELGLGWQLTAQLVVNGNIAYDCTLNVECDGGKSFGGAILPLAESRLLALAEIPEGALDNAASASLVFSSGSETIEYSLIG